MSIIDTEEQKRIKAFIDNQDLDCINYENLKGNYSDNELLLFVCKEAVFYMDKNDFKRTLTSLLYIITIIDNINKNALPIDYSTYEYLLSILNEAYEFVNNNKKISDFYKKSIANALLHMNNILNIIYIHKKEDVKVSYLERLPKNMVIGIPAKNLVPLNTTFEKNYDMFTFMEQSISINKNNIEQLQNKIILLRHIEGGICEEYYTGARVVLFGYSSSFPKNDFSSPIEFAKYLKDYNEDPKSCFLAANITSSTIILQLNHNLKYKMYCQQNEAASISQTIEMMEKSATKKSEEAMKKAISSKSISDYAIECFQEKGITLKKFYEENKFN